VPGLCLPGRTGEVLRSFTAGSTLSVEGGAVGFHAGGFAEAFSPLLTWAVGLAALCFSATRLIPKSCVAYCGTGAMLAGSDWEVDTSAVRQPDDATHRLGDEGKAVGCAPPTALLSVVLRESDHPAMSRLCCASRRHCVPLAGPAAPDVYGFHGHCQGIDRR
jgi:hypothetical protein